MTSLERTPWSLLHPEEDKAVKLTPHEVDLIAHALTKLADEYDRHPTHTPEEENDYRLRCLACRDVLEKVGFAFQNPELTVDEETGMVFYIEADINTNKTEQ
jgi:hypothetical protein